MGKDLYSPTNSLAVATAASLGGFPLSMTAMERMDKNKDKLVSKAEFLEMMGKLWDMKAKEMKLKAAGANEAEMRQILMYMRAGG